MIRRFLTIATVLIIAVSSLNAQDSHDLQDEALRTFKRYLNNVQAADYNACAGFWNSEYLREVYKLGISYSDAPYKFDLHSPLFAHQQDFSLGRIKVQYQVVAPGLKEFKILVNLRGDDVNKDYEYFLKQAGDAKFYFMPRYWTTMQNMKTYEGRYYELHYFNSTQINDSALARLDREIEEIGAKLELSEREMRRVEADKLTYILCANSNQVRQMAGHETSGWHDRSANILITSFLPHGQLVADLLIDYKLGEIATGTIPLLRYGLPVFLGGLPGADLGAYGELAYYGLANDLYQVADLLTYEGFEEKIGGADFAYPLAGYFLEFLHDRMEMKGLLSLYKQFSANRDSVEKIAVSEIRMKLYDYAEKTIDKLADEFEKKFKKQIGSDLSWGGNPKGEVVYQSGTGEYSLNIYDQGDHYVVEAEGFKPDQPISCALVFSLKGSILAPDYQPTLFTKHFPEHSYQNQYYSLIFDSQEAGTYDYLEDCITAKHLVHLNGTPDDYDQSHLVYSVDKKLLPADFSQFKIEIVEQFR
ncbi:MAG: hypothetical protein GF404_00775 [candidate division Zixibacteria bacterium]|nr:hypothetical protein [candidate division Zixibacteria bacterium]